MLSIYLDKIFSLFKEEKIKVNTYFRDDNNIYISTNFKKSLYM